MTSADSAPPTHLTIGQASGLTSLSVRTIERYLRRFPEGFASEARRPTRKRFNWHDIETLTTISLMLKRHRPPALVSMALRGTLPSRETQRLDVHTLVQIYRNVTAADSPNWFVTIAWNRPVGWKHASRLQAVTADYNCRVRPYGVLAALMGLLLMGCAPTAASEPISPTPAFITATLPATPAPRLTSIPGNQTATATPTPLIGTTTTQINVRDEPRSMSPVLGLLDAATAVQIQGKDPGGNWYRILYEAGGAGIGWVASEYVRVENAEAIPVVGGGDSEPTASVREQINVRRGPGTNFDSLGTLNARDVVALTGKDNLGAWLQIAFASGPGGKGWVAASFLDTPATDRLPIVAESGEVVGTSTPTGIPPVPTPTLVAAREDGDSAEAPAIDIVFAPSGVGSSFYSSEVSAPEGDTADWIRFTPYYEAVTIRLACAGNGQLTPELRQAGKVLEEGGGLACGETREVTLEAGRAHMLRLTTAAGSSELTYVKYTVSLYGAASP